MTKVRNALVAAILKSLLRGKSIILAFLAYWSSPSTSLQEHKSNRRASITSSSGDEPTSESEELTVRRTTVREFLAEAEELLLGPVGRDGLRELSAGLKVQFIDRLLNSPECMLPSYNHLLPTGRESGQYLALDVGGSTLRVALVELRAVEEGVRERPETEIVRMMTFKIDHEIKNLEGMAFFDWMAERILGTISQGLKQDHSPTRPLAMSLAWSFPIEQTSLKGGLIQGMGKGFLAANGLLGEDLGEVIKLACRSRGLNVELHAILNDSSATLLSQSYSHPSTRFGLILGTGVNIAAYLPVPLVGRAKFGIRPREWFDEASRVIVNTELGMFGRDALPLTRWDRLLKLGHPRPEFQPLEHMVSGFYLGEVCRLALVEAIERTGVFGGVVPPSLREAYALDTETLSLIEGDSSRGLEMARLTFSTRHPSTVEPTAADMTALRSLASFISRRSSAIIATCVFTLWDIRLETEQDLASASSSSLSSSSTLAAERRAEARAETELERTMVAFNGSVIENYPRYLTNCQGYVDELVAARAGEQKAAARSIDLVLAKESSIIGAAVALGCVSHAR